MILETIVASTPQVTPPSRPTTPGHEGCNVPRGVAGYPPVARPEVVSGVLAQTGPGGWTH